MSSSESSHGSSYYDSCDSDYDSYYSSSSSSASTSTSSSSSSAAIGRENYAQAKDELCPDCIYILIVDLVSSHSPFSFFVLSHHELGLMRHCQPRLSCRDIRNTWRDGAERWSDVEANVPQQDGSCIM